MVTPSNPVEKATATPTRAFFVDMIVKDVSLNSAILDLVDNCVDGALRLRPNSHFDGLYVLITINSQKFVITDNCGGIDIETAKNYAFKFGKDPRSAPTPGGVGLFGVGMKRAIFKLGKKSEVESTSKYGKFKVQIDVEQWLEDTSDTWTFPMTASTFADEVPETGRGITITIRDLFDGVSEQFATSLFTSKLDAEISARHAMFLQKNLNIKINGRSVTGSKILFRYLPRELVPIHREDRSDGIAYSLYAGIGDSSPELAGWYVYCNGRMVVKADQSDLTGWGDLGVPTGMPKIPKFHHQFARFRGCTYFESDDPTKLPWKTTKDGLDVELPLYRAVKLKMILAARPVISFLNELDKELDEPVEEKRVLAALVSRAALIPPADLPASDTFVYPKPEPRPKPPQTVRIQYDRPKDQVERLKKCLRSTSARRVGELTFDWYLENECKNE